MRRRLAVPAVATLVMAAGLAAYPVVGIAPAWRPLIFLGILAFVGLTLAMAAAWPQAVGWSLALLVLQYGLSMVGRSQVDRAAVLYVASLFVIAELAIAVIERRPVAATLDHLTRFDFARIALFSLLAATVAGLVLIVGSVDIPDWRWLPPVAVGAATTALAGLGSLARRQA